MSDRTLQPPEQAPAEHAGCGAFEQTLALLDGLLEGGPRDQALRHAGECALCGPLVSGWSSTAQAFVHAFEDAAEAAKPDLAGLTDRVLAGVYAPATPVESEGLLSRFVSFARRAQPWLLLGATAAALALFMPALLETPAPTDPVARVAPAADEAPPVVVVRDLDFGDDSNGMVYRTPRGGMTVIWVTENEGA